MAQKIVLTMVGMQALQRAIVRAPELVKDRAGKAVQTTAFVIAQRMRAMVPVRTGQLRGDIHASSRGLTGRVEIGVGSFYWPYLEYGTRFMAAQPFVRPSTEAEASAFEQRIRSIGTDLEKSWSSGTG